MCIRDSPYVGKDEKCRFKAADVGADDTGKCRNAVGLSSDSDDNRRLPNTCNDTRIMYVYDIMVTCHVGLLGKRNVRHFIWCPKMTPAIEHFG